MDLRKCGDLAVRVADPDVDPATLDVVMPHPDYGRLGFVAVLNPTTSWPAVRELVDAAHAHARARHPSSGT